MKKVIAVLLTLGLIIQSLGIVRAEGFENKTLEFFDENIMFNNNEDSPTSSIQIGDNIYVKFENNNAIITGTGKTWDYYQDGTCINNQSQNPFVNVEVTQIIVEQGIEYLGNYLFYPIKTNAEIDVQLPSTLTEIGAATFKGLSLKQMIVPEGVVLIGDSAFRSTNIDKMILPKSLKELGNEVFYYSDITYLDIPNIATIGSSCFSFSNVNEYSIGSEIEIIENYAFANCAWLKEIPISEKTSYVGSWAFYNCDSLTEVIIPETTQITEIMWKSFGACANLQNVELSSKIKSISFDAFDGCEKLVDVTVYGTITNITGNPFRNCISLKIIKGYECSDIKKFALNNNYNFVPVGEGNHNWDDGVIKSSPTCVEPGKALYTCTVCNKQEERTVDATGHTWNATYTIDKEATCLENGEKTIRCTSCNAIKPGSSQIIPASGHQWDKGTITQKPTCTENGKAIFTCNTCTAKEERTVDATGHTWNATYTVDKEATCLNNGEKSIHCDICNAVKPGSTIKIPATDHLWTKQWLYNTQEHWKICVYCNDIKSRAEHIGQGNICEICGGSKEEQTYYVIFDAQGGSAVYPVINLEKDSLLIEPISPQKEGYIFKGWYSDRTYTKPWNFQRDRIQSNLILYAKWEQESLKVPSLHITARNTNSLKMSWNAVDSAEGYTIWFRSEYDTEMSRKIIKGGDVTSWTRKGLQPGTKYFFAMRSWVKDPEGGYVFSEVSPTQRGTTKPMAAKITSVTADANGNVKVRLAGEAAGAEMYSMCYSESANGFTNNDFKVGIRTSYTTRTFKETLEDGTYYIRVKSYRDLGNNKRVYGEWSNTHTIVIK